MKRIWTKVGALALAGITAFNVFIPFATATDADPTKLGENVTSSEQIKTTDDRFTVESMTLDFGRITELGRSYTKEIVIKNNTSNDVIIDASTQKKDGMGDSSSKLVDWIAFVGGVSHFNVAAQGTRSLNVRILVPEDAIAGSQYANVVLTDANGYSLTVMAKADVAGEGLKYASEVSNSWLDPVRLDETVNAGATVKNTGTAGFSSTYQIKSKSIFGAMDWTILKEETSEIAPGQEYKFSDDSKLGYGIFSIEQRVTFVNSEGRMVESLLSRTVINLPWWGLAIAGGVIVLLIIIIVVAKRRKKSKASEKMKKAEKKSRKADIDRIERAEEAAISKNKKAVKEEKAKKEAEAEEDDEIEEIAEQLEEADNSLDDDAEFDSEEAVPIKVRINKKK